MKFNVSGDLIVPFVVEVEADNEQDAEQRVEAMSRDYLLRHANTENDAMGVSVDYAEPAVGRNDDPVCQCVEPGCPICDEDGQA